MHRLRSYHRDAQVGTNGRVKNLDSSEGRHACKSFILGFAASGSGAERVSAANISIDRSHILLLRYVNGMPTNLVRAHFC